MNKQTKKYWVYILDNNLLTVCCALNVNLNHYMSSHVSLCKVDVFQALCHIVVATYHKLLKTIIHNEFNMPCNMDLYECCVHFKEAAVEFVSVEQAPAV